MFIVTASNQGSSSRNNQQTSSVFATEEEAVQWAKQSASKNLQNRYIVYQAKFEVNVVLPEPVVKVVSI